MRAFKPIQGSPPSIEWQAVANLLVDETYQRPTDSPASIRLIERMAEAWDWRLCAPLTVSKRDDDKLYVIDGQHRLEAARLRGDVPHLPVIISRFSSLQDEARCFVNVNTERKNPTPLDKFHARCLSGDPDALEIKEIVEAAGLQVGRRSWSYQPKDVSCVAVLCRVHKQYGKALLSAALVNLAEAYPGEALRSGSELIPGIAALLLAAPRSFDPDIFAELLASRSQVAWVGAACWAQHAAGIDYPDEAFRDVFAEAYAERVAQLERSA
jgi:hypothetical protein